MRLKVLISAYACSPYQGSEPGSSWGLIERLSYECELWIIVEEEKFKVDITRWQNENPGRLSNVRFYFIRKKRNRILRRIWPPSYYWYYKKWQMQAFHLAKKLDKEQNFDVVHQLTMSGFREPGFLWKLPNKNFVWGPIGGMGFFPKKLLLSFGVKVFGYYTIYNLMNYLQMRLLLRPRQAAKKAGVGFVAANIENRDASMMFWKLKPRVISEVGKPFAFENSDGIVKRNGSECLKLIWVGQMISRKGLTIALDAVARLPKTVEWKLDVFGDGPLRQRMMKKALKLGVADRCTFRGKVDRLTVLNEMKKSHIFLQTSMRDLTSTVLIEALASGLPVISFPFGGFKDIVNEKNGMLLSAYSYKQMVSELALAIISIYKDERLRQALAQQAILDAEKFSWENKASSFMKIYWELHSR